MVCHLKLSSGPVDQVQFPQNSECDNFFPDKSRATIKGILYKFALLTQKNLDFEENETA